MLTVKFDPTKYYEDILRPQHLRQYPITNEREKETEGKGKDEVTKEEVFKDKANTVTTLPMLGQRLILPGSNFHEACVS